MESYSILLPPLQEGMASLREIGSAIIIFWEVKLLLKLDGCQLMKLLLLLGQTGTPLFKKIKSLGIHCGTVLNGV